MSAALAPFDALYRASPDPWSTDSRWYEERKRGLVLAMLPERRYASAYEAGCGNGNLSAPLAERCDALLASDGSLPAVAIARARLQDQPHVTVLQQRLPRDWPQRRFDLIVLSELLYFLESDEIDAVARHARHSIESAGTVVVCHWRAAIEGYGQTGDDAHRRFGEALELPRLADYRDDDVVVTTWSPTATSIAMREGLR